MKKLLSIFCVALLQSACALVPQTQAIQAAVEHATFEGLIRPQVFMFPYRHLIQGQWIPLLKKVNH